MGPRELGAPSRTPVGDWQRKSDYRLTGRLRAPDEGSLAKRQLFGGGEPPESGGGARVSGFARGQILIRVLQIWKVAPRPGLTERLLGQRG